MCQKVLPTRNQENGEYDRSIYPVFRDSKRYLECREGNLFQAPFKRWAEYHAINRCLALTEGVDSVLDIPCGPGRLFPYWRKRGFRTYGFDISDPIWQAAATSHQKMALEGFVGWADAFAPQSVIEKLPESPDIICSIRFLYYFKHADRVQLLRGFQQVTRRYVLVQYKTIQTLRGRITFGRRRPRPIEKQFCTFEEIRDEMEEAGLKILAVQPIGFLSDRVFIIGEKKFCSENGVGLFPCVENSGTPNPITPFSVV